MTKRESILESISGNNARQMKAVSDMISASGNALADPALETSEFDDAWKCYSATSMVLHQLTALKGFTDRGDYTGTEDFLRRTCSRLEESTSSLELMAEGVTGNPSIDSRNVVYQIFRKYLGLFEAA